MKKSVAFIVISTFSIIIFVGCADQNKVDVTKPHVTLSFSYNEGLRYLPTYAIWVEDESGNLATLYATKKAADNRWGGADRSEVLPIWFGIREANVDTVSSATPSGKVKIQRNLPDQFIGKILKLFIEANASFDYNEFYKEGLMLGDEGYCDVNGQPSMLWVAELDQEKLHDDVSPSLVGAGDVVGANHEVNNDLDNVTSAKALLKDLSVKYDFIE